MNFLQNLPLNPSAMPGNLQNFPSNPQAMTENLFPLLSNLLGIVEGLIIAAILVSFAIYIYLSIAYSKIGKKTGLANPGIAWLPGAGPLAIIFETAKDHWWPFLVLAIGWVSTLLFTGLAIYSLSLVTIGYIIFLLSLLIFGIMTIIWHWKTYKAVNKPGWWILVPVVLGVIGFLLSPVDKKISAIISFVAIISHLVFISIAAWGSSTQPTQQAPAETTQKTPEQATQKA